MSTIQILVPYQPWFMIISCDEFVVERDANLFIEMYIYNPLFDRVGLIKCMKGFTVID